MKTCLMNPIFLIICLTLASAKVFDSQETAYKDFCACILNGLNFTWINFPNFLVFWPFSRNFVHTKYLELFDSPNFVHAKINPLRRDQFNKLFDEPDWPWNFKNRNKNKTNFWQSMFLFPLLPTIVFWKYLLTFQNFQC